MSDNIYLKKNEDWEHKIKYGYVNGESKKLINRLSASTEEHSEMSEFIHIFTFKKKDASKLPSIIQIDKIISLYVSDIKKLEIIEDMYNIKLPLMHELNKHLVKSKTKQTNEFVNKDGIPLLIRVLKEEFPKLGLELVKEYSSEEIQEINTASVVRERKQLEQKYKESMELMALSRSSNCDGGGNKIQVNQEIKPNDIQIKILKDIEYFYQKNNIGKIIAACGVGKTLTSLFITKLLKSKTILIGVPYSNLLKQWATEILKLYPEIPIKIVGGYGTTKTVEIEEFISSNKDFIIITTYSSSHIVNKIDLNFDFKIGDEAHHLVSKLNDESKQWIIFHKIKSNKSLYMTATEKFIENKTRRTIYSMEDETIFGKHICQPITIKWAIDNNKITDYRVVLLRNTEDQVDDIIKSVGIPIHNKQLFISAYVTLKALQDYGDLTHILMYCNKTENANLIIQYIQTIIDKGLIVINRETLYFKDYHSKTKDKDGSLNQFKKSKLGILSCVYELGEGTNIPELNGVVFVENMDSENRIVQCALRANRLNSTFPDKIGYYIIPYIDTDDWHADGVPFEKVKKIISKLGNEDDTISQKIIISEMNNKKKKKRHVREDDEYGDLELDDEDNQLHKLKLRLRYKRALKSKCSPEEDELNMMRYENKQLNISDKHNYVKRKKDNSMYKDNPDGYFIKHGVWKGWYDFLDIDTSKFIKTKDEWIIFCKEKSIKSVDMYKEMSSQYCELPNDPKEFYVGFTSIPNELGLFNRRR